MSTKSNPYDGLTSRETFKLYEGYAASSRVSFDKGHKTLDEHEEDIAKQLRLINDRDRTVISMASHNETVLQVGERFREAAENAAAAIKDLLKTIEQGKAEVQWQKPANAFDLDDAREAMNRDPKEDLGWVPLNETPKGDRYSAPAGEGI